MEKDVQEKMFNTSSFSKVFLSSLKLKDKPLQLLKKAREMKVMVLKTIPISDNTNVTVKTLV